eukprot:1891509-Prymnesium_polylepis.1
MQLVSWGSLSKTRSTDAATTTLVSSACSSRQRDAVAAPAERVLHTGRAPRRVQRDGERDAYLDRRDGQSDRRPLDRKLCSVARKGRLRRVGGQRAIARNAWFRRRTDQHLDVSVRLGMSRTHHRRYICWPVQRLQAIVRNRAILPSGQRDGLSE